MERFNADMDNHYYFLSLSINTVKIWRTFKMELEILNILENSNLSKKNKGDIVKTNMWKVVAIFIFYF